MNNYIQFIIKLDVTTHSRKHASIFLFICLKIFVPGGGGGGTQIWFGRGCAAQASKALPIIRGHFGSFFSRKKKNSTIFGCSSGENGIRVKSGTHV